MNMSKDKSKKPNNPEPVRRPTDRPEDRTENLSSGKGTKR